MIMSSCNSEIFTDCQSFVALNWSCAHLFSALSVACLHPICRLSSSVNSRQRRQAQCLFWFLGRALTVVVPRAWKSLPDNIQFATV